MAPPFIKRYLIALDKHKAIGIVSFILITGVSGGVALLPAPQPTYKAQGILAYNSPPASFSTTGGQIQAQGRQLTLDVLLSDNVIIAAATRAKVNPQVIAKTVQVKLPKEPKKGDKDELPPPQQIQIIYPDDDRKRAQTIVEVLMQQMVEQSRSINTARVRAIIESIQKRLPEAKKELTTVEQQLERYDRIEGPALLAAQDGTLVGGITGSQEQQRQIELTLEGVETQINSLVRKLGLNPEQAYTASALSADPIIANLRAQILQSETQIAILSRDLRPEHPQMIELQRQQQAYEKLLQERAGEVLGGNGIAAPLSGQIRQDSSLDPARQQLANTLVTLQTQRETLIQQLQATKRTEQELRQEYQTLPNKQLERARLLQQVQLKQDFYSKLEVGLADAKAAEAETVSSLSIARPAQAIEQPVEATNTAITLGAGIFIALLVSGGLIFLLSTLDNTLYTPEELQEAIAAREVPILGELPFIITFAPEPGETAILAKPDSPYLEFYERFRSNLRRGENKSVKVVLLTSTVEGEGKTVSAYNLAIASAQAGKRTLLVEADLRSPSHAKSLKVVSHPDASIEPLRYYSSSSECIQLAPDIENLYIIPSPGPQRKAAAILESSEMQQLLKDVRGRYDFVVIDTPTLTLSNDALLLEPLADGIILVTRPGYSQGSILLAALDELTEADPSPLLGAIINGVDKPIPIAPVQEIEVEGYEEETSEEEDFEEKEANIPTGATRF